MKKLFGVIIAILVLAAAGVTGASYWSGLQAERWYEGALAEGSKSNIKLSTVRYQRGLFSSHVVTRVDVARPSEGSDPGDSDLSFAIRQDIYHGPLPLAGRDVPGIPMEWAGAVVRATLDPDSSAWTRELAKWYSNQEPVIALSKIAFDGASDTQITMPPLTLNDVEEMESLQFSGLQGQFQVAAHSTAVQGHLTVDRLEAAGKPEAVSEASEAGAQPAAGGGHVTLSGLTMTVNQRKGAFGLLFGESSFKIGELHAQDQTSGAPFSMTGLSMTGSLSQQNPQQVAGEMLISVGQITADQQSGTGRLHLALRNLDGSAVEQLQQWQQKISSDPDNPQALSELLNLVKTLLRGKPELTLNTQANMTEGDWQGQLILNFQDFGDMSVLQGPAGFLAVLEKGQADVAASKTLVETVLIDTIREELLSQVEEQDQPAREDAVQNMAAMQANQQLQELMSAGFIRLEGDRYKAAARFEGGKLFVNDQEIPLMPSVNRDESIPGEEMPVEPTRP